MAIRTAEGFAFVVAEAVTVHPTMVGSVAVPLGEGMLLITDPKGQQWEVTVRQVDDK